MPQQSDGFRHEMIVLLNRWVAESDMPEGEIAVLACEVLNEFLMEEVVEFQPEDFEVFGEDGEDI